MATFAGRYDDELQDRFGNAFALAKVAVQTTLGAAVTLYADRTKTAYVPPAGYAANEIQADSHGNLRFFADPGNYQIVMTPSSGTVLPAIPASVYPDPLELPGGPPTGGAGGVLSGTFPNPGFAVDMAEQSELNTHTSDTANPHVVTKAQIGLGNADNTSDVNKPVSTAQQTALNLKLDASQLDIDGTLAANSDTKIPSQKAVKTYADQLIASADAMVFKGVIDASSNPNYPAADKGHTYRISVAGKIGGAAGPNVEIGDLILALVDGSAAGTQAAVGANWSLAQSNIDGAVIGPAAATDSQFAAFNGTSGKLIKDSGLSAASFDPVGAAAAVQALAVLLAGAQTVTGPKTFEGANAATVVMATRVAADTQNRWERRADGSQAWGTGAAAVDVVMSRVTRGLNLAGKLEVVAQNAADNILVAKAAVGHTGALQQWVSSADVAIAEFLATSVFRLGLTPGGGVYPFVVDNSSGIPAVALSAAPDANIIYRVGNTSSYQRSSTSTQTAGYLIVRNNGTGGAQGLYVNPLAGSSGVHSMLEGIGAQVRILSGSVVDARQLRAYSPTVSGGAITNSHGLFIDRQKLAAGVTNGYGIWQDHQDDLNRFAGEIQLDHANALLRWKNAALEQLTVGAAGAGAAPPATPAKWLKVKDSAGTTLVVPAYAAA